MIHRCFFKGLALALLCFGLSSPAHAADDADAASGSDAAYLDFDAFSVSIITDGRVDGQISVKFSLAVADAEKRAEIERKSLKLRDAYLQILSQVASTRLDPRRPVDPDLLDRYLQRVTDRLLGDHVAEVVMESAAIRPL
ncbi:MAG: hypothetical protein MI755_01435 [Sphingomonadales bacterium]|nr:hypothetical protein [Sphingomonadales bacterium]